MFCLLCQCLPPNLSKLILLTTVCILTHTHALMKTIVAVYHDRDCLAIIALYWAHVCLCVFNRLYVCLLHNLEEVQV